MNKIVYSLRIMEQLVERGFIPISMMPNPKYPQFNCWIFENTNELNEAFASIVQEANDNER